MAKIKSYSDLQQSKKLAEILPLESVDMCYINGDSGKISIGEWGNNVHDEDDIPCWSLTALLSVTRNYCTRFELTLRSNKKYNLFAMTDNYVYRSFNEYPDGIDEPIDVCVALIEKLHELKML